MWDERAVWTWPWTSRGKSRGPSTSSLGSSSSTPSSTRRRPFQPLSSIPVQEELVILLSSRGSCWPLRPPQVSPKNRTASNLSILEKVITAASACFPINRAASELSTVEEAIPAAFASLYTKRELCFRQNYQRFLAAYSPWRLLAAIHHVIRGESSQLAQGAEPCTSTPTYT